MNQLTLTCLLIGFCSLTSVQSAKILAIFPFPGRSQYIFVELFLKNLAKRGHDVTVINTFGNEQEVQNFRVIGATKIHEYFPSFSFEQLDAYGNISFWKTQTITTEFLNLLNLNILKDEGVQQLMKSREKFDLLIVETVKMEALYGFAQHFGATAIGISSYGTDQNIDELVGNVSPLSYNPFMLSDRTDRMTFVQRVQNLWESSLYWVHKHVIHLPSQEQLYNKYFPNASISFKESLKCFSLVLLGQHFSLSYPRPYVPNMIEVGGLHLTEPKPLPKDIENFINASKDGVVYFSMGSNIKSKDFPKEKLAVLLNAFGRLKQRVLWKFELDKLPGQPKNVFISKWLPQSDILAHPNVKLFITHGGLLSIIEAIYHAKPVLGLPVFFDQHLNVNRATETGYGLSVDIKNLTVDALLQKIEQLINEKNYTNVAKRISNVFRDQPQTAMERAIYWTEYVIRHKGASHLRVAAMNLSFTQLHSFDTIIVIFGGIGLVMLLIFILLCKVWKLSIRKLCDRNKLKQQ